jgi:hypothetical protein
MSLIMTSLGSRLPFLSSSVRCRLFIYSITAKVLNIFEMKVSSQRSAPITSTRWPTAGVRPKYYLHSRYGLTWGVDGPGCCSNYP